MRLAVFTTRSDLRESPHWTVIECIPGIEAVLLCRQHRLRTPEAVVRRLWRNLRKHGLLFLPYRLIVLARDLSSRSADEAYPRLHCGKREHLSVETLDTYDLHSPTFLERVRSWQPDLGLSIGAPILRRELFDIPKRGTLNIHGGRVPDFRGAPPGFWEVYTGADRIGATLHRVEESLDTGEVIEEAVARIYPSDTLEDVKSRSEELSLRVLWQGLTGIVTGDVSSKPQPPGGTTYRFPTPRQRLKRWLRSGWTRFARAMRNPGGVLKSVVLLLGLVFYRPMRDMVRTALGRHPVRIFTFHRVTTLIRDGMTVPPATFVDQLRAIGRSHRVVGLEEALSFLRSAEPLRRPVAVITFDDGYRSVFETALPLMRREHVTGTCFLCTDLVGTDRRLPHDEGHPIERHLPVLTWEQVESLADSGWDIESHTATHVRLADQGEDRLTEELTRPMAAIRERIGSEVNAISFPYGGPEDITDTARNAIRRVGYRACLSDFGGENFQGADLYHLRRIELGGDHAGLAWRARVHGIDLGGLKSMAGRARSGMADE